MARMWHALTLAHGLTSAEPPRAFCGIRHDRVDGGDGNSQGDIPGFLVVADQDSSGLPLRSPVHGCTGGLANMQAAPRQPVGVPDRVETDQIFLRRPEVELPRRSGQLYQHKLTASLVSGIVESDSHIRHPAIVDPSVR